MAAATIGHATGWARVVLMAALLWSLCALAVPTPAAAQGSGSISGTVAAAGSPVAHAWVSVTPVTPTGAWAGRDLVSSTDSEGRFRLEGVQASHVKLHVRPPAASGLASAYWPGGRYAFGDAHVLEVAQRDRSADIQLVPGGSVSGVVVAGDPGTGVSGARVSAYVAGTGASDPVGTPRSRPVPGGFVIHGLPPVPVVLFAAAPSTGNLLGRWYDGAGFAGAATTLDGGAATTGLRVPLVEGGEIVGTVRDDTGEPVAGARIALTRCPGLCPLVASTDDRGGFRIGSIPPGRGLMLHASAEGMVEQWYARPGEQGEARIDLGPGEALAGLDLVLTRGAYLSASVVDAATGLPVPRVSAELESLSQPLLGYLPGSRDRLLVRSGSGMLPGAGVDAPTGTAPRVPDERPAGAFVIGPVPPGEYRLVLYPGYRNPGYLPVVWGGQRGIGPTGRILLEPGQRAEVLVALVGSAAGDHPGSGQAGPAGALQESRAPADAPVAAAGEPSPRGGWPGLTAGAFGPAPTWVMTP